MTPHPTDYLRTYAQCTHLDQLRSWHREAKRENYPEDVQRWLERMAKRKAEKLTPKANL